MILLGQTVADGQGCTWSTQERLRSGEFRGLVHHRRNARPRRLYGLENAQGSGIRHFPLVAARLRTRAELVRPTAPLRPDDYEAMADAIDSGQRFIGRWKRPAPDELTHIQLHLAAASADNLLNQIDYDYGSPSQSRARGAILGLMKRRTAAARLSAPVRFDRRGS